MACTESYSSGTSVSLTASPAAGSFFSGWSGGGCSNQNPCKVTISSDLTITANFVLYGTDSDGNGLPDGWEQYYFSKIGNNPNADPDFDGLTNLQEYQSGTSPINKSLVGAYHIVTEGSVGTYTFDGTGT